MLRRSPGQGLHILGRRYVRAHGKHGPALIFLAELFQPALGTAAHHHAAAFFQKSVHTGSAYARSTPCNDHDLVTKSQIHHRSPFLSLKAPFAEKSLLQESSAGRKRFPAGFSASALRNRSNARQN